MGGSPIPLDFCFVQMRRTLEVRSKPHLSYTVSTSAATATPFSAGSSLWRDALSERCAGAGAQIFGFVLAKLRKSKDFQRRTDETQQCVTKSSGTYAIVVGQRDK